MSFFRFGSRFMAAANPDGDSLGRFLSYVDHVDKWKLMHRKLPSSYHFQRNSN